MSSQLSNTNKDQSVPNSLQVYEGGTGAKSVPRAQINLDILPNTLVNVASGMAVMPAQGLSIADFGDDNGSVLNAINVEGPATVSTGVAASYTITDYDISTAYEVTAVNGTVLVTGATITLTAGSANTTTTLNINNRTIEIPVVGVRPNKPTILTPTNNAIVSGTEISITGSAFSSDGTENHASSDWEVATDSAFLTIVKSSYDSPVDKTTFALTGGVVGVTYFMRVRYKGSNTGLSDWSDTTKFSFKAVTYPDQEEAKFIPADAMANDGIGSRLAVSGDGKTIAIGSWQRSTEKGSVYVIVKQVSGWVQQAKLSASDGVKNDRFGIGLALTYTGDTLFVGADAAANGGAVYEFTRTASVWAQKSKVQASDTATGIAFGQSLSLSGPGNRLVVGAPNGNGAAASVGVVYILEKTAGVWVQKAKVFNPSITTYASFGNSVSISGDGQTLLIGAERLGGVGGAFAYKLTAGTWTFQKSFDASFGYTGCSVSLSNDGNTAVIGSYNAPGAGKAAIYTRVNDVWSSAQILSPGFASDRFGISTAINASGTIIAVGSDAVNSYKGAAYIYKYEPSQHSWTLLTTATQTPATTGDYLGFNISLSTDGDVLAAGAFNANSGTGATYIFS